MSYGANRGVRIAIEDVPPGGEPGEIYTTLENQKKLFQGLDIGFCLDIGHVPLLGADLYREVDAAGDRLITLHVHNNSGTSDDHNLPTDGIIDWPALHDYIREKGYRGKFVLEIYGGPDRPAGAGSGSGHQRPVRQVSPAAANAKGYKGIINEFSWDFMR